MWALVPDMLIALAAPRLWSQLVFSSFSLRLQVFVLLGLGRSLVSLLFACQLGIGSAGWLVAEAEGSSQRCSGLLGYCFSLAHQEAAGCKVLLPDSITMETSAPFSLCLCWGEYISRGNCFDSS